MPKHYLEIMVKEKNQRCLGDKLEREKREFSWKLPKTFFLGAK